MPPMHSNRFTSRTVSLSKYALRSLSRERSLPSCPAVCVAAFWAKCFCAAEEANAVVVSSSWRTKLRGTSRYVAVAGLPFPFTTRKAFCKRTRPRTRAPFTLEETAKTRLPGIDWKFWLLSCLHSRLVQGSTSPSSQNKLQIIGNSIISIWLRCFDCEAELSSSLVSAPAYANPTKRVDRFFKVAFLDDFFNTYSSFEVKSQVIIEVPCLSNIATSARGMCKRCLGF